MTMPAFFDPRGNRVEDLHDYSLAAQGAREDVANACGILLGDVRGARTCDWQALERAIQLLRSALTKTAR